MDIDNFNILPNISSDINNDMSEIDLRDYNFGFNDSFFKKKLFMVAVGATFLVPYQSLSEEKQLLKNNFDDVELCNKYIERDNVDDYVELLKPALSEQINAFSFPEIVKDILSFQDLKNDWDGYGAYPLENKSGVNSISILEKLGSLFYTNLDDYYPNPTGTLSLDWEREDKLLGLEIGNEEFSFYFVNSPEDKRYFNNLEINTINIEILKENLELLFK